MSTNKGAAGGIYANKKARSFDIGKFINRPFLRFIPPWVKPNQITLANHVCNWILFGLSVTAQNFERETHVRMLVAAGVVNFICMMLDCLDGMHARNTNQTSKLGEVLDHWLDAIHVPMVCASISFAFGMEQWILAVPQVLNAAHYAAELIVFHYHGVFVETVGEEAQITTTGFYFIAAYIASFPVRSDTATTIINLIVVIGVLGMLRQIMMFVSSFRSPKEGIALTVFTATSAIPAALYLWGAVDRIPFLLLITVVSFRISGSYVLLSILRQSYSGYDVPVVIWLAAIAVSHIILPGSLLVKALPFAMIVHVSWVTVSELRAAYPTLQKLK